MNIRTPLIRSVIATALASGVFALAQAPQAAAAEDSTVISIEARTPLLATLLPKVTIIGHANDPDGPTSLRVAATEPLSVTLLPTVFVNVRRGDIAEVLPANARVTVDTRIAARGLVPVVL